MKFTIDVMKLVLPTHRLQKDETFRKIGRDDYEIQPSDLTFDNYLDARNWKINQGEVNVDEELIEVNPKSSGLMDSYFEITSHRINKPKQMVFSKQEVENVLRRGNDNIHNTLVIDFDGFVHLVPFEQAKFGYAVKFETFGAGNGYVGSQSSLNHLDGTYRALLEGWHEHLVNHGMVHRDYETGKSEADIISDIQEAYNNL